MFWLIETQDQFDRFKLEVGKEFFMLPIYKHPEMHPGLYAPLCLYIHDLVDEKDYLINFSHSQALPFDILQVKDWVKTFPEKIYVPDRKAFHHFAFSPKTCDLNLVSIPDIKANNQTINYFTQRFYDDPDLNNIIPIVIHFEYSQEILQAYKSIIKKYQPNQYHNDISDVFWFIEKNGLKVNSAFERYFDLKRPFLSRHNSWVLTQYNLNTTTGRPSNTFNGLNFAALNKDNQSRSVFIPRNDFLMEIDLTAYHPTLISKMVGYESPTGDIYEDFAKEYGMDRVEAKNLVFKQLYGHVYDQYKNFEFFKLTQKLIEKIWNIFDTKGEYLIEETGKVFSKKELPNMNPQKLFNYIIQHTETSNNVALLQEILYIVHNRGTKVVLYTYDALLLDASKEDRDIIKEILNVFEQNKLKVKISYGNDYDSLQNL
jgi:hypothetical protein